MKLWALFFFLLILVVTTMSALAIPGDGSNSGGSSNETNSSSGGSSGGLPQRIALVEKVLEVEHLTKQPQAEILGTDYLPSDEGKLQAYLKVGEYPLENAVCYVSVLYPDMNYFIQNQLMFDVGKPFFEGLYYHDFIVPNVTGVYPVNAYCFYDANVIHNYVSEYSTGDFEKAIPDTIDELNNLDDEIITLQDKASCNNQNCTWNATIILPIGWHTNILSDIRVLLNSEQTKSVNLRWFVYYPQEDIKDYWFNQTTLGVIYNEQYVVNYSRKNNTQIVVGFNVFDSQGNSIDLDLLRIDRIYNGSYVSDLRGNNELVVSNTLYNTTLAIYEIVNAEINVVDDVQLEQVIIIIIFFILIFAGFFIPASMLGMAYSFIYLDGILTLVGAGICALILVGGWKNRKKNK